MNMKNLFKNRRLSMYLLFAALVVAWLTVTLVVGPPDEAPPFLHPGG